MACDPYCTFSVTVGRTVRSVLDRRISMDAYRNWVTRDSLQLRWYL